MLHIVMAYWHIIEIEAEIVTKIQKRNFYSRSIIHRRHSLAANHTAS